MGAKNLHLEHLEDEIINQGIDGGRGAINFLQGLRDMLKEIEYTELAKKDQEKVTAAEETLRRSPLPIFVG